MAPSSGSADAINYLIHHVVLPPKLPQKRDYNASHERHLLETTICALQDLRTHVNDGHVKTIASAIAMIENLRDSRDGHGDIREDQLHNLLIKLTASKLEGPIPLHVKAQNAGILIEQYGEHVTFEFFELSPTNKAAMECKGRLIRSFPALASSIPVSDLRKKDSMKSLARTISKMSTQAAPGMQPKIRKNRQMMDEERDTTNPAMVTDYLLNFTAAMGTTTDVIRITKNTREDVLWADCLSPWRRSPLWLLIRVSLQLLFTRQASSILPLDTLYKGFMIQLLSRILLTVRILKRPFTFNVLLMTSCS